MRSSESIAHIAPALVKATAELTPVVKDAVNPAFRNRYATLDSIMDQVRPVMAKHGLAVLQGVTHPDTDQGHLVSICVETRILHISGEWIAGLVALPIEKPTAQGTGSAISYGRRYGLSAMLGLTAEDDDGNAASLPAAGAAAPANRYATTAPARSAAPEAAESGKRMYETVPDTPRRKPFTGNADEALNTPFPFKKKPEFHGKPLRDIPMATLESTLDWCRKTDADKFHDLIQRLDTAVRYLSGEPVNDAPAHDFSDFPEPQPLDDLPF